MQIVRIRRGHSAYAEYGNCRASGPYAPRVVAFETANANRGSTAAPGAFAAGCLSPPRQAWEPQLEILQALLDWASHERDRRSSGSKRNLRAHP